MKIGVISYGINLKWENIGRQLADFTSTLTIQNIYYVGNQDHCLLMKNLARDWGFCTFVELCIFAISPRFKTRRLSLSPRSSCKLSEEILAFLSKLDHVYIFTDIVDGVYIHELLLKKGCKITTFT